MKDYSFVENSKSQKMTLPGFSQRGSHMNGFSDSKLGSAPGGTALECEAPIKL